MMSVLKIEHTCQSCIYHSLGRKSLGARLVRAAQDDNGRLKKTRSHEPERLIRYRHQIRKHLQKVEAEDEDASGEEDE